MQYFSRVVIATCALALVCANPAPRQAVISAGVSDDFASAAESGVVETEADISDMESALETGFMSFTETEGVSGEADEVMCLPDLTCPIGYSKSPVMNGDLMPPPEENPGQGMPPVNPGMPLPAPGQPLPPAQDEVPAGPEIPLPAVPAADAIPCHSGEARCPNSPVTLGETKVCCPPGYKTGQFVSTEPLTIGRRMARRNTCECVPIGAGPPQRRQAIQAAGPAVADLPPALPSDDDDACMCTRDDDVSDGVMDSMGESMTMEESMTDMVVMSDEASDGMAESDAISGPMETDDASDGSVTCLEGDVCDDSVIVGDQPRCCPAGFMLGNLSVTAMGTDCRCVPV